MITAGLNGFGRFGQHAIKQWLERPGPVSIEYINDPQLTPAKALQLISRHDKLDFSGARPALDGNRLLLTRADGLRHAIRYTCCSANAVSWRGLPQLWLECSGLYATAAACRSFVTGQTVQVLVGATSRDADQTLVYGFNHRDWNAASQVVSYGSCTVNAFIVLADWLNTQYGVTDADVHVVHNVPAHRLDAMELPRRHPCTLETMAPRLLPWLPPDRFLVDYVLTPHTGVSCISFRFGLRAPPAHATATDALADAIAVGPLARLYELRAADTGATRCALSSANAVLTRSGIAVKGNSLYLSGYFDNENSAARYVDMVHWLASRLMDRPTEETA